MDELDLIPEPERAGALLVADRLRRERPVPRPAFRGDLRRSLMTSRSQRLARLSRRQRWVLALVNGAVGCALLAAAAVGVAGAGPLAS